MITESDDACILGQRQCLDILLLRLNVLFIFLLPPLFLILLLLLPLLARDCLVRSCKLGDVDGVCDVIDMHSKLWIGGSHLLVFGLKTVPAAQFAS